MRLPHTTIFDSALTKLTLTYSVLLIFISFGFSLSFYQASVRGLNTSFIAQTQILERRPGFKALEDLDEFRLERRAALDVAISDLQSRLILTNLLVIGSSIILSYALAKQSLKPIEEAHDAQVRFTADASHELKTPLAAMQTEIDVNLRNKKLTTKQAREILVSNREEVDNMTRIVTMLLGLANSENKIDAKEEIDLNVVAKQAVDSVKKQAQTKKITITLSSNKHLKIKADAISLKEAIIVLLDNAIKYSHENSNIEVNISKRINCVELEIKDFGIGISKQDIEHIFERFYRGDKSHTKSSVNGYGLGLALAKQIVEAHNGNIKVSSKLGQGSSFTITMPN